jgi:predicted dehydrogenase
MRPSTSRRQFFLDSLLRSTAVLAASQSAGRVWAAPRANEESTAIDRLGIAVIGTRGQGNAHLGEYLQRGDCEILYIVDVDQEVGQQRCAEVEQKQGRRPKWVADLREMLDDKSVDCVSIATPNHWHALAAIWSIQAGKHVYVEKPVSHTVEEGRRIVQAARKYGKVCQTGTQSRSSQAVRDAIQYLHAGTLGELKCARGLCYKRRTSIGGPGVYTPPSSVDYNLWLGPAPEAPLTRPSLHYDWHWMWDYGNGDLGNQGIHQMDIARWGMNQARLPDRVYSYGGRLGYVDAGQTANTQVCVYDYGPQTLVFEVRGLETNDLRGTRVGVIFECEKGYVIQSNDYFYCRATDLDGNTIQEFRGGEYADHFANFLAAVRANDHSLLNADIEQGHLSSALCHLGNISYRLGREVDAVELAADVEQLNGWSKDDNADTLTRTKDHLQANQISIDESRLRSGPVLQLQPEQEEFVNHPDADQRLRRVYRAPFVVPDQV